MLKADVKVTILFSLCSGKSQGILKLIFCVYHVCVYGTKETEIHVLSSVNAMSR